MFVSRLAILSAVVLTGGVGTAHAQTTLTVSTVNNSDMIVTLRLSTQFEQERGIGFDWVVLEENVLRQRVTTDIATSGGQFDVITIGAYETPIWGAQDWLVPVDDLGEDYDYDDILEPVRTEIGRASCRERGCQYV